MIYRKVFTLTTISSLLFALLLMKSVFVVAGDKWTKKADMPTARDSFPTSVVNGKIYAIGGWLLGDERIDTVEEYDPARDRWTRKADMPTPRWGLATSVVEGKIYAIGGWVPW